MEKCTKNTKTFKNQSHENIIHHSLMIREQAASDLGVGAEAQELALEQLEGGEVHRIDGHRENEDGGWGGNGGK